MASALLGNCVCESAVVEGSYPPPADPLLAEMAVALTKAGHWAEIVDVRWRIICDTAEVSLGLSACATAGWLRQRTPGEGRLNLR
jgi:hypothetical protein